MKVHPNGTPLTSIMESLDEKNLISVLSMNLLAPLYVRSIDKRTGEIQPFAAFEWVKDDAILDWDTRKLRLLECMIASEAQVICLQELQLERESSTSADPPLVLPDWIQSLIDQHGYTAVLPPQDSLDAIAKRNLRVLGSDSAVSNAVLVKKEQWKVLEQPVEEDTEPVKKKRNRKKGIQRISSGKNSNTMVSVCLESANNDVQADPVVISCVHLDATNERRRVLGLAKCLERCQVLQDYHQKKKDPNMIHPLRAIIVGDMNAEFVPGSCMVATLREYQQRKKQRVVSETDMDKEAKAEVAACAETLRLTSEEPPTKEQVEDWRKLRQEAYNLVEDRCVSLDRVPTGPTRCAYEHAVIIDETLPRVMQSWKLDHMLYTCSDDGDENDSKGCVGGVRPIAYWATLEADPTSCQTGLPNATCPSDHLPIAAIFEIPSTQNPTTKNDESSPLLLLKKIQDLGKQHKEVVNQTKAELRIKLKEVQQKEQKKAAAIADEIAATADNPDRGKKKKKASQKRGPPSAEMMELKRNYRSHLKALQMNQAREREELVREMGNHEKLVLQAHCGMPWRHYLEHGMP